MSCVVSFGYLRAQAPLFTHGIFRNPVTLYGVSVSVAVMIIVVYAPFLQVCCTASGIWRPGHCRGRCLACTPTPDLSARAVCVHACRASLAPGACRALAGCHRSGPCCGCCPTRSTQSAWCAKTQTAGGPGTWPGDVPGTGSLCQGVQVWVISCLQAADTGFAGPIVLPMVVQHILPLVQLIALLAMPAARPDELSLQL